MSNNILTFYDSLKHFVDDSYYLCHRWCQQWHLTIERYASVVLSLCDQPCIGFCGCHVINSALDSEVVILCYVINSALESEVASIHFSSSTSAVSSRDSGLTGL